MKKNIKTNHSRKFLSGIFNACCGCIDVKNIFNVKDLRLQPSGMTEGQGSGMTPSCNNSNKAFTLIELLVVVLIVGILAAIALPQYEKAVTKAKFSDVILRLDAVAKAQEMFYLANGQYSTDYTTLDIDAASKDNSIVIGANSGLFCYHGGCYRIYQNYGDTQQGMYFWGSGSDAQMFPDVFVIFNHPNNVASGRKICCYSQNGTSKNDKLKKFICDSFGGETATRPSTGGGYGQVCKYF